MDRPKHISEILDSITEIVEKARVGSEKAGLINWYEIAGSELAKHSSVQGFRKGILTVKVDSSTFLFKLNLMKDRLLVDIKAHYPNLDIEDMKFTVRSKG